MSICRITVVASLLFLLVPDAVAQEGYERNDAWSTRDQAARRGLTDASNASREHQGSGRGAVEYGGWIYETHDGGYGYTSPYTSHDQDTISGLGDGVIANPPGSSSDQSYEPRLPTGERIVGVYHNHPNYGTHDTEHFSGPDLNFAELYNIPIYLITPQNDYIKYDPDLHDPADFDFAHDNDEVESYVDDDESRVAHAEGEPHLGTHDGRTFDFQAAGEFIAIQSDEDDLTVMLRFEHYAGLNFISVVTGVSVAVGSDRVGIYASPPHLMINGEIANANNEPPVGIVVLSDGDTVTLTTAAGDKIVARRRHNEWLDVEFAIASARQGRIQGLLGDFDGDPENDYRTRDGELVDMTSGSSGERSQKLYGFWGASWRVGQPESIFDYAHGKTAGDYQDFDIPRAGKTYADLARDTKFTAAAKMCRDAGTYRKTALEHCIFDIVVTGDTRFADTYRDEVGISYATVVAADAGVEISGTISSPGETTRHRILFARPVSSFSSPRSASTRRSIWSTWDYLMKVVSRRPASALVVATSACLRWIHPVLITLRLAVCVRRQPANIPCDIGTCRNPIAFPSTWIRSWRQTDLVRVLARSSDPAEQMSTASMSLPAQRCVYALSNSRPKSTSSPGRSQTRTEILSPSGV